MIVDSGNGYLGALKGNQSGLLSAVERNFQPEQTVQQIDKGHGRIEKRAVSISHTLDGIPDFPGLATLIRVESERQVLKHSLIEASRETRYYIASFGDTAQAFADRIRAECSRGKLPPRNLLGYWGVENKVHYVP